MKKHVAALGNGSRASKSSMVTYAPKVNKAKKRATVNVLNVQILL